MRGRSLAIVLALALLVPAVRASAGDDEDADSERKPERTSKPKPVNEEADATTEEADATDEEAPRPKKKKKKKKKKQKPATEDTTSEETAVQPGEAPVQLGVRDEASASPARLIVAAEALGAAPLDGGNRDLFGMGGGGGLGVDVYVTPLLGIHAGVTVVFLATGSGMSSTTWIAGHLGPRLHLAPVLLGARTRHDAWLDAHVNYGSSGGIRRPGFDVGGAFQWGVSRKVRLGPVVRYQFGSDPRSANAQVFTIGLALGFGARTRVVAPDEGARDSDGDGVTDLADACPDEAAGAAPDRDREGCPIPDQDGDGVLDVEDSCADKPIGERPDPARAGCPFEDRDGDNIADASDKCPGDAGAPDPFTPSQHGCPTLARVVNNKIEILQQIFFETDSATIKSESTPVLAAIASAMRGLAGARVRVEGHTDQQGSNEHNLDLSRRRARAVAQWLIQNGGIDASRLETEGYGKSRPLVSGSDADVSQNRRVEFLILDGR